MKRAFVLGLLVAAGTLASLEAQPPQQQGPRTIDVDKVKDNLWVLKGGGGNTAVFVTADGVTVVDAKNPGWGQPILDKIKELTPKPVTRLINTHTHGDHVSGNVEFPASVEVVTQENTKTNMEKMDIFKQNSGKGLPKRTFKDKMTIGKDADQIDLYYFGPGHTNGDAWVVFPALRTVHAGDLFAGKNLPLVDPGNGGSVLRYHETLNKVHSGIKNVDTIINGHIPVSSWNELKEYQQFLADFAAFAEKELKAGKTADQAAAEYKVDPKFKGYVASANPMFGGPKPNMEIAYKELKK